MYSDSDGFFWIGGPGEEAFNVPLGLQVKKGQGLDYDFLHLHYRSSAIVLAMGVSMLDAIRQMHEGDRPVLGRPQLRQPLRHQEVERRAGRPTIETQYSIAPAPRCAEAPRRRRHHHRHRRRRRHGRGRLRLLPGLVVAPGQRAADPDHRHEQRLGHLDAGAETARRAPHRRPRRGARHSGRRSSTATIRRRPGSRSRKRWSTSARSASPSCSRRSVSRLYGHSTRSGANRVPEEDCIPRFEERARARATSRPAPSSIAVWEQLPRGGERRGEAGADRAGCRSPATSGRTSSTATPTSVSRAAGESEAGAWRTWRRPSAWPLHYGEEHLGVTDVFGEDVGPPLGGVFTATQGLKTAWNSPLDERGIIGTAMGSRWRGRARSPRSSSATTSSTPSTCSSSRQRDWGCNGEWHLPMVVMTPVGAGIRGSIYHSHSFDALATHIPGWKIVMPSTPLDAYGLMISALQGPEPGDVPEAQGAPAHQGRGADPRRAGRRASELKKMIDAPLGDRSAVEAAVAGARRTTRSRSARRKHRPRGRAARPSSATAARCRCARRPRPSSSRRKASTSR